MDDEARKLTTVSGILYDVSVAAVLVVGTFFIEWLKRTLFPEGAPWGLAVVLNFSEITLISAFLIPFLGIATAIIRQFKVLLRELGAGEVWPVLTSLSFASVGQRLWQVVGWGLVIAAIFVAVLGLAAWLGLLDWWTVLGLSVMPAFFVGLWLVGFGTLDRSYDHTIDQSYDHHEDDDYMFHRDKDKKIIFHKISEMGTPNFYAIIIFTTLLSFILLLLAELGPFAARLLDSFLVKGPLAI